MHRTNNLQARASIKLIAPLLRSSGMTREFQRASQYYNWPQHTLCSGPKLPQGIKLLESQSPGALFYRVAKSCCLRDGQWLKREVCSPLQPAREAYAHDRLQFWHHLCSCPASTKARQIYAAQLKDAKHVMPSSRETCSAS